MIGKFWEKFFEKRSDLLPKVTDTIARWDLLKKESLYDYMKFEYLEGIPPNKRTPEQSRYIEEKS